MSNGVPNKTGVLQTWQQANLVAAINYLGEIIGRSPEDARAKAVYEGLLQLLDPARRLARAQRELSEAARTAAFKGERRHGERRQGERRAIDLGSPTGVERRTGTDRRTGQDRRRH